MGKAVKILSAEGQILKYRVCAIIEIGVIPVFRRIRFFQIKRLPHPILERQIVVPGGPGTQESILSNLSIETQLKYGKGYLGLCLDGKGYQGSGYFLISGYLILVRIVDKRILKIPKLLEATALRRYI